MSLLSAAHGLDPHRLPSQYVREQWSVGNEFPGGSVNAIAQTPDGYLWIGTDSGLVLFDGFNFTPVPLPSLARPANVPVLGLITDAQGRLWVRPQGADVLRQKEGGFEIVAYASEPGISQVTAIGKDGHGGIIVADVAQGMFRFVREQVQKLGAPAVLPGSSPVISIAETAAGKIWMGTLGTGLFVFSDSRAVRVDQGLPDRKINCLLPVSDHELWVGTDSGLYRWDGKSVRRTGLPASFGNQQVLSMMRDRDANVWVGTTHGLLRVNDQGSSVLGEAAIRGSGGINALFEDREGNLWIGGPRGLARIRDSAFVTYSTSNGLRSQHSGPLYIDVGDRTWFASAEGGLYALQHGRAQAIAPAVFGNDVIYSIAGRNREIWVGRQRSGLTRLELHNGNYDVVTYRAADGLAQNSVYSVFESRDGTVWVGTLSAGVSRLKDGKFTTYTTASGLASNTVSSILEAHDGTLWFATSNGLSSLSKGQWRTYTSQEGLPADNVECLFEDPSGVLWSGTSGGLAFLASDRFEVPRTSPGALHEQVFGIAQDKNGSLWIATSNHVLQVRRDKLLAGNVSSSDIREFGPEDGLLTSMGVNRSRSVVADSQGRIWFSLAQGVSVVDPSCLPDSSPPAIAHIEALSMDGTAMKVAAPIHVPRSSKRITFAYTGLSLAAPERIRFRYLLDGFDRRWSEPVAQREAVYTNLAPGSYRFRVIASNSYGEWNGSESAMAFEVEPAFWQTWSFRFCVFALAGFTALLLYRSHIHRVTHELNLRFEERLAERTRIAQELHDTLLQGFLSASMQLHVADDRLQETSPAKPIVRRVLELMTNVIDESRNAVRGLRSSSYPVRELHEALCTVPEELGSKSQIDFRVIVEGQSRPLRPFIRDDLYRMGREALVNAFRHSEASSIQLELEYGSKELRVLVRDNGRGMDEQVVNRGREGHWGLPGMKERAQRIGARLRVWSHPARGTEIEISVPAEIAFEPTSGSWRSNWFSRFQARRQAAGSENGKQAG